MPSDLTKRLREYAESGFASAHKTDCVEAADEIERLEAERDAAISVIDEHAPDKPLISRIIMSSIESKVIAAAAQAEVARLRSVLTAMLARFEIYAGPNDMHAGHHDLALLKQAREALEAKT